MKECEAVLRIKQAARGGSCPGLVRMEHLMKGLGNPEKRLAFVHIAGTNGKGSTAAMLSSICRAAGYRTGLFTSPHLLRYNERIMVDGQPVSDEELLESTGRVLSIAETMSYDRPTEFELLTAVALDLYAHRNCDMVVLETGMGGRLDSTNIIPAPEVAILTNIGLDHTEVLGDTLAKIAAEKAGILKPGCRAVMYPSGEETEETVRAICEQKGIRLSLPDFFRIRLVKEALDGQAFSYGGRTGLTIRLLGMHQLRNAAVVLEAVDCLNEKGFCLTDDAVTKGLAEASWPGRFEIMHREPLFLVDGGHNPQCAQALCENLLRYFPGRRVTFLLGIMADKDYGRVLELLLPFAGRVCAVTPGNDRALPAEEICRFFAGRGVPAKAYDSVADGVLGALASAESKDILCSFGSLYMTGEVRQCLSRINLRGV